MDKQQGEVSAQREYSGYSGILGDSEDSDEELISEALCWEQLTILERLGLNSCEDMTQEEVEHACGQFAMGFHCDQYTYDQRLRAEEHDRSVALENLRIELQNTRDTLQMLCIRRPDGEVREKVKELEESLETLESSMDNIITTAETLGATHQEARQSQAMDLMALHVEHLKEQQSMDNMELLHTRKLLLHLRGRLFSDSTEDGDVKMLTGDSRQVTRRRVSITLIPTQAQLSELEVKFLENCQTEETQSHNQEQSPAHRCAVLPVGGSTDASLSHTGTSTQLTNKEPTDDPEDSPVQVTLRRRGRAVLRSGQSSGEREDSSIAEGSHDPNDIIQSQPLVQHPLWPWMSNGRGTFVVLCGTFILILILLLYVQ